MTLVIKERDYILFKDNKDSLKLVKEDVELTDDFITNNVEVLKVAKRGYHQDSKLTEEEKDIEAFKVFHQRKHHNIPLKNNSTKLATASQFLSGKHKLNEPYTNSKESIGLGTHNTRYNCETLEELLIRIRINNHLKKHGYADVLDAKRKNPEWLAKELKRYQTTLPKHQANTPPNVKIWIAWMHSYSGFTYPQIQALLPFYSVSTIKRITNKVKATKSGKDIFLWFREKLEKSWDRDTE